MDKKNKRNTKEEIINVAIDLFAEKGVSSVSVRDITKVVGINESSLYNHFNSKNELLDAIIEKFQKEFGELCFLETEIDNEFIKLGPELFFQHHIIALRNRITPQINKIWIIVYMEQFRDQRAREFVIKEIIGRPAHYYEVVLQKMMECGVIETIDTKLVADEYNYAMLAMSLERMLLQVDKKDVSDSVKKMFSHIKFISDRIQKK